MLLLPEFVIRIAAAHSSVFHFYLNHCLFLAFFSNVLISISKLVETKVSHRRSLSLTKWVTCKFFSRQIHPVYPYQFVCLYMCFSSIPDQDFLMTETCQRGMIATMKHFKALLWRPWWRRLSVVSTGHAAPIGSITSSNSNPRPMSFSKFIPYDLID